MNGVFRILMILIPLSFPLAQVSVRFSGIPLYIPEILLACAWVTYLSASHGTRMRVRPFPRREALFLGLFFTGSLMSVLLTSPDAAAFGALKSWIIFPGLWAVLLFQIARSAYDREAVRTAWFAGAVMTALVSLTDLPFIRVTYDGRLASFYPSPNHLAMFLEAGVLIGIFCTMTYLRAHKVRIASVFALGAAVLAGVLLKTDSQGALLAVVGGSFAPSIVRGVSRCSGKRLSAVMMVLTVFMVGVAIFNGEGLISRSGDGTSRSSLSSRVMIWDAALIMVRNHPIVGIGPRRFQEEYLSLQPLFPPYLEWAVPHAHNLILSVWLGTGIIGLIGFILLVADALRHVLRRVSMARMAGADPEYGLYLAVSVALLLHGLVDTPFLRNDLSFGFFTVLGLVWSAGNDPHTEKPSDMRTDLSDGSE